MLEENSLTQDIIRISTSKQNHNNILERVQDTLTRLKFKHCNIKDTDNKKLLYATLGQGHPHVLFMSSFPDAIIKKHYQFTLTPNTNNFNAKCTALACFLHACEKFTNEQKFKGRISIFIQNEPNFNYSANLKSIFKKISLTPQTVDFCIIGEPNNNKKINQEINIGSLGDILFTITSYGSPYLSKTHHTNAVQNLLTLLHKLTNTFLDNGNESFSSSSLNFISIDAHQTSPDQLPEQAKAKILVHYNNNHTPQEIINWMKNNIIFTNGQFELNSELISHPFISDISEGTKALQQSIHPVISKNVHFGTNCTSELSDFIKDYCPFAEFGLFTGQQKDLHENITNLQEIYYQFLSRYFSSKK